MSKLQNPRCPTTHLLAAHILPGEGVGGAGGGPQAGEDQQRDDHGAGHGSQLPLSRRRSLWSAADTKHADLATTPPCCSVTLGSSLTTDLSETEIL